MRKIIILTLLIFVSIIEIKATEPLFVKGNKAINIGVGLEYWRIPITISGEYCISDGIIEKGSVGLGVYGGIGINWGYRAVYDPNISFMAGARGSFHYPFIDKLDTYAGLSLGIDSWYSPTWIRMGGFIGARYPLSQNLFLYGELGSGLGYLNLGASFKF
jgi:hypothetical protein